MKYFSIDLETSGLNSSTCQILEFAAIFEDTSSQLCFEEIPKFERIINHKELVGSPGALHINSRLLKILAELEDVRGNNRKAYIEEYNIIGLSRLKNDFYDFVFQNLNRYSSDKSVSNKDGSITINVAGKNFGTFDLKFLDSVNGFKNKIRISQRILDPSILYADMADERLPNLLDCKRRAGIKGNVTHKALDDAWDVVKLLRYKL